MAEENAGEVLMGTLGWTGNFRFTFEVDNLKKLRVISGINPYFSTYSLPAKEVFRTPDFFLRIVSQVKDKQVVTFMTGHDNIS